MTSPDTQTNWNGILGKMELQVFAPVDVLSAVTESDASTGEIKVVLETLNTWMLPQEREILVGGEYVFLPEEILPTSGVQTAPLYLVDDIPLPQAAIPPYQPRHFLKLHFPLPPAESVSLPPSPSPVPAHSCKPVLKARTGAAPMEIEGWLKVMRTAKRFGINHYRFHTCCPPEAAFFAADLLGIYMEPELPFWGTIAAAGEEGYNEILFCNVGWVELEIIGT